MLKKATQEDIKAIASLHELVLSESIFVKLGRHFLERYYHHMLVHKAHVFSYVFKHDEITVGFIAMTSSHELFYREIQKDAFPLSLALLRSILNSPKVFFDIIQALRFLKKRDALGQFEAEAELLQIAVHPDFRVKSGNGGLTAFFKKNGVKIAEELFTVAMKDLKDRNVKDFRIMTGDTNIASNRFYTKMGCNKIASAVNIFGCPTSFYRGNIEEIIDILHNTRA
jgi:ribosomal protein S18 acetylase RimI-like enzyme